jgi:hypothetical protein
VNAKRQRHLAAIKSRGGSEPSRATKAAHWREVCDPGGKLAGFSDDAILDIIDAAAYEMNLRLIAEGLS